MRDDSKKIPVAVKRRLPRYLRALGDLKKKGVEKISSGSLSDYLGYTASQIRQDLNHFGGFGQQGYGYNVEALCKEIEAILGLDKTHSIIIVGVGHLGQAMANYVEGYEKSYELVGLFDIKPALIGTEVGGIKIRSGEELEGFLRENSVDIAALCVNVESAQTVADKLAAGGVRGILNFAVTDLNLPAEVKVENVHISEFLEILTFDISDR